MKTKFFYETRIIIFFVLLIVMSESCYRKFYKVSDNPATLANHDNSVQAQSDKYFILRSGGRAFHMQNIAMSGDNKSLTCQLTMVDIAHTHHLTAEKKKGIPYLPARGESAVLTEVHIYIPSDSSLQYNENYMLDLNQVSKIETLEKDTGRTTLSTVVSTLEIAFTIVAVPATIIGLSMSSW